MPVGLPSKPMQCKANQTQPKLQCRPRSKEEELLVFTRKTPELPNTVAMLVFSPLLSVHTSPKSTLSVGSTWGYASPVELSAMMLE